MRSMEQQYRLMHRLGITPWDRASVPEPLRRLVEGPSAEPNGTALDLGCGTGMNAAYLAGLGWDVTAVDVSPAAIAAARARSNVVRWVVADLTVNRPMRILTELAGKVSLILDVGCLHGLTDRGRRRWGRDRRTGRDLPCAGARAGSPFRPVLHARAAAPRARTTGPASRGTEQAARPRMVGAADLERAVAAARAPITDGRPCRLARQPRRRTVGCAARRPRSSCRDTSAPCCGTA